MMDPRAEAAIAEIHKLKDEAKGRVGVPANDMELGRMFGLDAAEDVLLRIFSSTPSYSEDFISGLEDRRQDNA